MAYEDDADATVGTVTRTDNQGSEVSAQERQLLGQLLGWRGVVQNNTWKDWGERGLGWIARHYDRNLRVLQHVRGSDEEVHRAAARWARD